MDPLVSIIMPAFNAEKYIKESIESVLQQSFQDSEIIVVDDGSRDGTGKILEAYKGKVKVVSQENGGPSSARNRGIRASKGKYIAFLDADDLWPPNKLELQVGFLESHPNVGMVFGDMSKFNEKGVICDSYIKSIRRKIKNCYEILLRERDELSNPTGMLLQCNLVPTGSVMIRRNCLEKSGLFDENLWTVEDLDLWIRVSLVTKIAFIPKILKKKREHESNISSDFLKAVHADVYIVNKLQKEYPDFRGKYRKYCNKRLSKDYFFLGYNHFSKYELTESRALFLKSILRQPNIRALVYLLGCLMPKRVITFLKSIKKGIISGRKSEK